MPNRHVAALTALALPCLALVPATTRAEDAAIRWGDCTEQQVGSIPASLAPRLSCGSFDAPLDHVAPDGRTMQVGVVRVRAARSDQRQGSIFLNVGGPGANPSRLLRSMANAWSNEDPYDPDTADKYRLAQRFDLVAVIPRGLHGGWQYRCVTGMPSRFAFLPSHLDDANWQRVREAAQADADACSTPVEARYINTEQHVHDMDLVRRALGDARLHFYGISYGGKVGAWYAAMYPDHVGRMLLDSSMLFTHDFRAAVEVMRTAQRKAFREDVLAPILADPTRYGLATDPADVTTGLESLPGRTREAWHPMLDTPPRVAAALWLADWIREAEPASQRSLEGRVRRQVFSPDAALNRAIGWAAMQLIQRYYAPPITTPRFDAGQDGDSVRLAVGCNDAVRGFADEQIRARAVRSAIADLHSDGKEILEELTCSRWRLPAARQPDLDVVERAPPFLLLQGEKDLITPIEGARNMLGRFANARLLVARGSAVHGLFNFTTSACVERTAARYLVDGSVPASDSRELHCDGATESPVSALPHSPTPRPAPAAPTTPRTPSDEL
jgi:pimeloyl-ACP methyl ester carboxylesterase